MSNIEQIKYMKKRMKQDFNKGQGEEKRRRETNDRIYNAFQSVTDIPPLVNMRDALKEVRKKNDITFEDSYLKVTGGFNPMKDMETK